MQWLLSDLWQHRTRWQQSHSWYLMLPRRMCTTWLLLVLPTWNMVLQSLKDVASCSWSFMTVSFLLSILGGGVLSYTAALSSWALLRDGNLRCLKLAQWSRNIPIPSKGQQIANVPKVMVQPRYFLPSKWHRWTLWQPVDTGTHRLIHGIDQEVRIYVMLRVPNSYESAMSFRRGAKIWHSAVWISLAARKCRHDWSILDEKNRS